MYTISLFDRLKLSESFSRLVPTTMLGESIISKYQSILSNTKTPISDFHNLMLEALGSGDKVLENWARQTSSNISENHSISWRFNMIMESMKVDNNVLTESVANDLRYLEFCGESSLTESIMNGALSNSLAVPALKNLHEDVTGMKTGTKINENCVMYTPISYIERKNNANYFSLNGRIYEDSAEGIAEAPAPSVEFEEINDVAQSLPYDPSTDEYSVDFFPAAVNITSNGKIKRQDEIIDIQTVHDIVKESTTNETQSVQMTEARKFDNLKKLYESLDKMYKMDNITSVYNTVNKNTVSLVEHESGYYVISESGIHMNTISLKEALKYIKESFDADLTQEFQDKLQQEEHDEEVIRQCSITQNQQIEELQKVVEMCTLEQSYCESGSEKWQEFEDIKQDAKDGIDAIQQSIIKTL